MNTLTNHYIIPFLICKLGLQARKSLMYQVQFFQKGLPKVILEEQIKKMTEQQEKKSLLNYLLSWVVVISKKLLKLKEKRVRII